MSKKPPTANGNKSGTGLADASDSAEPAQAIDLAGHEAAGNQPAGHEGLAADQLNRETGVLAWQELVRFFARGVVIKVHQELDLVDVGHSMSIDDTATMQSWLDAALVSRASDDDARDWNQRQPEFWCLVAAPWLLVQERDLARESRVEHGIVH